MMRQFIKYTVEKMQQLLGRCLQWVFFFFFEGILLAGCLEVKHMCASAAGDSL